MATKEKVVNDEAGETTPNTEKNQTTKENSVDKRLTNMENEIEQLKAHAEMQKSATEVFQVVKTLLEALQAGANGKEVTNPFLKVLAPGTAPEGQPQDGKALMEAITKATSKVSSWKPAEPKTEN